MPVKALRHFYRCADCLTIAVTVEAIEPTRDARGYHHYAECAGCGGDIEYMGPVTKHHIIHTEWQCACDGRCTGAIGPSCDCRCGGEHHGTGAMVEVLKRLEGLPRVMTPSNAAPKAEAYRALAAQFRAAWDSSYAHVTREKRSGYIGPASFQRYLDGQNILASFGKARSLRTHGGRNKRIAALIASLTGSVSGVAALNTTSATYCKLKADWLDSHKDATVIAVHADTGEPAYAEYLYLDGALRKYPARFEFPEPWMIGLFL